MGHAPWPLNTWKAACSPLRCTTGRAGSWHASWRNTSEGPSPTPTSSAAIYFPSSFMHHTLSRSGHDSLVYTVPHSAEIHTTISNGQSCTARVRVYGQLLCRDGELARRRSPPVTWLVGDGTLVDAAPLKSQRAGPMRMRLLACLHVDVGTLRSPTIFSQVLERM
jgi:hypothetical protein